MLFTAVRRLILGALLVVIATSTVAAEVPASTAPDFGALRLSWATYLHAKNLDSAIGLYAANAVFGSGDGHRIVGKTAIRKLFAKVMKDYTSTISFRPGESGNSGQLGYDSGSYDEMLVRKTGAAQHFRGTYITIFRRARNGTWLIIEQAWSKT